MPTHPSTSHYTKRGWLGLLFPLLFLVCSITRIHGQLFFSLFDDAMISMTYARTFVETGELVWFEGAARIQGYTNLLWTLYMAGLHRIGLSGSNAALAVSLTSVGCLAACAYLGGRVVKKTLGESPLASMTSGLAIALMLVVYPLTYWSVRGMEVGLIAVLAMLQFFFTWAGTFRHPSAQYLSPATMGAALVAILGVLTRLDFAALSIAIALGNLVLMPERKPRLTSATIALMVVPLSGAAVLAFQYHYYGDTMPNTYRLKIEGYSVLQRLGTGLYALKNAAAIIVLVLASAILALRHFPGQSSRMILAASAVFFAGVAYSIWVGGDAWEISRMPNRYISAVLPFAIIALVLAMELLIRSPIYATRRTALLYVGVGCCITYPLLFADKQFGMGSFIAAMLLTASVSVSSYIVYNRLVSGHANPWYIFMPFGMLFFLITSGWGMGYWLSVNGNIAAQDMVVSRQAMRIAELTDKNAIIASVWAGAPAYYSHRPMVDLLGKSDRVIAAVAPRGAMQPGHNKWNYDYSIGTLKPDIIIQLWKPELSDADKLARWGYIHTCAAPDLAFYARKNSAHIRWEQLRDCPEAGALGGQP